MAQYHAALSHPRRQVGFEWAFDWHEGTAFIADGVMVVTATTKGEEIGAVSPSHTLDRARRMHRGKRTVDRGKTYALVVCEDGPVESLGCEGSCLPDHALCYQRSLGAQTGTAEEPPNIRMRNRGMCLPDGRAGLRARARFPRCHHDLQSENTSHLPVSHEARASGSARVR